MHISVLDSSKRNLGTIEEIQEIRSTNANHKKYESIY
jgi:hypothetical protein